MIPRYTRPEMGHIWSEDYQFDLWLRIEVAACEAWAEQGVINADEIAAIRRASFSRDEFDKQFDETKHDIVSFTRAVATSLGPEGRWIHHGMTSNDVKDTALSLQMVAAAKLISADVEVLRDALRERALEHKRTLCIGRSHGMHAEPMSFGLKLALWWSEVQRHQERLNELMPRIAVGMLSGPVGTFAGLPPCIEESVCRQLGLKPAAVSNQIIQRDRHAEFVQTLALIAATLEKMATEIRGLQRTEVAEVQEPFGSPGFVSKGSSSMPHKRNPELSERICGLARVIRGNSLAACENVALWHERDISHSSAERVILADSAIATDYVLDLMSKVISGMTVDVEQMRTNLEMTGGVVFSPRVMLELVEAGVDRNAAYDAVQSSAIEALDTGTDLREALTRNELVKSNIDAHRIDQLFDYGYFVRHVDHIYERVGLTQ